MQLEHYPVEKLRAEISEILERYLDIGEYRLFFFGSRTVGTGTEHSDIDIGIEGASPVPLHIMCRIRDGLESLPTIYTVEIVDFKRLSDQFRAVALQHVEPLIVTAK